MRVIGTYAEWLGEGSELAALRLLGLFDRPAQPKALAALRAKPALPGLTEPLMDLGEEAWQLALSNLREHGLLLPADPLQQGTLDAHPLVRVFFQEELEKQRPEAWQAGNLRLYEHLQKEAPDLPDTLESMEPLFTAVIHGCRAGRQQEALYEVYWRRIRRGAEAYSTHKLGALGSEMSALSGFFDRPWDQPSASLTPADQAFLLSEAGYNLRALGRLAEAVQPMEAGLGLRLQQENWENAAKAAGNLSELTLTLGEVKRALAFGKQSADLADRSGVAFQKMSKRTTLADALHQAGRWEESAEAFREAEALQAESQPQYSRLYSVQGYQYCDLLLSRGEPEDGSAADGLAADLEAARRFREACREVRERAEQTLEWATAAAQDVLSAALDHLSLGRAHLGLALTTSRPAAPGEEAEADFAKAAEHLDHAVEGLRRAGAEHHLPRALLAWAALRRLRAEPAAAGADLSEALEIAERGSMRLHECDAHFEWGRLCRQQGDRDGLEQHMAQARRLVEETGYERRRREVVYLEKRLAELPPKPEEEPMKDFFVSFTKADRAWADWIAWTLEEAGHQVVYQPWDFLPGNNFVLKMQEAASATRKTVIVLSDNYLNATFTQPEWAAAFAEDPRGDKRKLIAFRVAPCSPPGLLKTLIYADLVGMPLDEARAAVLRGVSDEPRAKPAVAPAFPGQAAAPAHPPFPGISPAAAANPGSGALALWKEKLDFLLEQEPQAEGANQKFALRKQIEEARKKIQELGTGG